MIAYKVIIIERVKNKLWLLNLTCIVKFTHYLKPH